MKTLGCDRLSEAIQQIISAHLHDPSLVHRFIASRAKRQARDEIKSPVVVFTANYDDVLEATFHSASVPYHLFFYQPDGEHVGRFVHRSPDGRLRAIRDPDGVYRLEGEAAIVVKMNGGLDPLRELPGRFVVTSSDFDDLASRVPTVLPGAVCQCFSRSLLFLGHELAEPDVRAVARHAKRQRGPLPAWAVQMPRLDQGFWRDSCGVEILEVDRDTYILTLSDVLSNEFGIET